MSDTGALLSTLSQMSDKELQESMVQLDLSWRLLDARLAHISTWEDLPEHIATQAIEDASSWTEAEEALELAVRVHRWWLSIPYPGRFTKSELLDAPYSQRRAIFEQNQAVLARSEG